MFSILASIFVGLTIFLHLYFLVLEMFLWTQPFGLKTFRQTLEKAQSSASLAMNQGLYNGFLAAGLAYGLVADDPAIRSHFLFFFLVCVIVAGIFGALTVNRRIFFFQALPAILALAFLSKEFF